MPRLVHITDAHIYAASGQQLKAIDTRRSFTAVVQAAHARFPDA